MGRTKSQTSTNSSPSKRPIAHALEQEIFELFEAPPYVGMLVEIVRSTAFQRLRDIRFLGAIDYFISANGSAKGKRHTRYEHSLHVARLAREYSRKCHLSDGEEAHLVVAGLLHDVGHGPLSHSMEPAFKEQFRLTHHEATELIISGTVPLGSALPGIFKKYGIERREIVALINGTSKRGSAEALRNPINLDTIEAISRAFSYISSERTAPPPQRVLHAMIDRGNQDIAILDRFWQTKDIVYDYLINSRAGVVADFVCREYVRRNPTRFWSGNYFITEKVLRREHSQLFMYLAELKDAGGEIFAGNSTKIEFVRRKFYIDEKVTLDDSQGLYRRYLQEKTPGYINVGSVFGKAGAIARKINPSGHLV